MWTQVKSRLGRIMPGALKRLLRRSRAVAIRRRNRGREAGEIFTEIYQQNRWGGEQGDFHSGSGSTAEHADRYARAVNGFLRGRNLQRVADLGCGDFRVGSQLVAEGFDYTGIDVVESLIASHRVRHGGERVRFERLDITRDALPEADVCLIRQVLQHLSNEQIAQVLHNTRHYRYVIVTEHFPAAHALRSRNRDKPCGEDVRVYDGSGVYLDAPPFNRQVSEVLLEVPSGAYLMHEGEYIRTFVLQNEMPQAATQSARAADAAGF